MKKLFTLAALFIYVNCFSQVSKGMPCIIEVVNKFFTSYAPTDPETLIQFQKRPQGWFVAEYDYKTASVNKAPSIFWNKATASYSTLDYPSNNETDTAVNAKKINEYIAGNVGYYEQYYFENNIFYGYDGWNMDVIDYAGTQTNVSDTMLGSLARAYSYLAGSYFYPQYGSCPLDHDSSVPKLNDNKVISPLRVKYFIINELKAIEAYKRLLAINPDYPTLVGTPAIRLANEKMFAYSTLLFIGHGKEGMSFLPGINISDSLLNIARTMLAQVKPNSIFFSSGDNVTYPLLYLQYQGSRKDVTIIDLNLIALKRVISYYDYNYHHSLFNVDSAIYMNEKLSYALFDDGLGENKELRLDSFLHTLYHSPDIKSIARPGKEDFLPAKDGSYKFFTKNTFITVNKASAAKLFPGKKLYNKVFVPVTGNYLFISEIMQFEILQKNFGRRHIYFSAAPYDERYLKYTVRYGNVFEFTPEIH